MSNEHIWILIEVRSGIPTSARAFQNERLARGQERKLRKHLNLDNDETGVFPVELASIIATKEASMGM
jgi:hypothetical protein